MVLHQQLVEGISLGLQSHLPLLETRSSRTSCLESGKLVELGTRFAAFHGYTGEVISVT